MLKNKTALLIIFFLYFFMRSLPINSQELQRVPNFFVSNFHLGHELSLFVSLERNHWKIFQEVSPVLVSDKIYPVDEIHYGQGFFVRYKYHSLIYAGFGFFLGSTFGGVYDKNRYGQSRFKPGSGVFFPTILAGLEHNFSPVFRIYSGIEYGVVWYPNMEILTGAGRTMKLAAVPDLYSFHFGADYFLNANTSLGLLIGYRKISNPCLSTCKNDTYVNNINALNLDNEVIFGQIGASVNLNDF